MIGWSSWTPRTRVSGKHVFVEDAVISQKGGYRLTASRLCCGSTSSAWLLPRGTRFVR